MIVPRTPVENLPDSAGWQNENTFGPHATEMTGLNLPVARRIVAETGDAVCWPCGTHAFLDDDLNALVLAWHGFEPVSRVVCLSALHYHFPLTRRLLLAALGFALDMLGASMILTRAPITDLARRDVLRRLGFRSWGALDAASLLYVLDLTALPPRIARARRRHAS